MTIKTLFPLIAAALLSACRIEIDVPSSGVVSTASGAYTCEGVAVCSISVSDVFFDEAFVAEPATGFEFIGWEQRGRGLCGGSSDECRLTTTGFTESEALLSFLDDPDETFYLKPRFQSTGFNSLLIGHSFFRPFAEALVEDAARAGIANHRGEIVFAGGQNGAPEALWDNANRRAEIQAVLDRGGIELFAMTYHNAYPSLRGYRLWIDYALQQNPEVRIAVALPWGSYPEEVDASAYDQLWSEFQAGDWHAGIDQLRREYPGTEIFSIPYGRSAIELRNLYEDGSLTDVDALKSRSVDAIFRDDLGHADEILIELGRLVWLTAVYDIDMAGYDYQPPYEADLKALAQKIMDEHERDFQRYDAPYR